MAAAALRLDARRRAQAVVLVTLALAGCANAPGFGTGDPRSMVDPRRVGNFAIEFADTDRAAFIANGREVVLRPAPGFCIAPESVDIGPSSGFAMVGDCPAEATDAETLDVPRAIPAIVTVSIAEEPMFGDASPRGAAISDLERFLTTPEGLATVGRIGDPETVRILETRAIGNALYVHVEDRDVSALPMLSARFWRAFIELNGRMVLVSLSDFSDGPMEPEQMLAHLAAQVGVLRTANGGTVPEAEAALAAEARVEGGTLVSVVSPLAPSAAPLAPPRRGGDGRLVLASMETGGASEGADDLAQVGSTLSDLAIGGPDDPPAPATARAPERAPAAPRRPR